MHSNNESADNVGSFETAREGLSDIQGKRIYLRYWKESDAPTLFKYASDPDVGTRAGWPPHQSEEESMNIIRTVFNNSTN